MWGRASALLTPDASSEQVGAPPKSLQQRTRDRTGTARTNPVLVNEHDRHQLPRGALEERLVGAQQVFVGHNALGHGDADLLGHVEEELAGDSGEESRLDGWRERRPPFYDEQVRLRALRELSAKVPHDGLERPVLKGMLHGQRVVQQVVRFDQGVQRECVVPYDWHDGDADTQLVDVELRLDVRLHDDDDRWLGAGCGGANELPDDTREQQADVRLGSGPARS